MTLILYIHQLSPLVKFSEYILYVFQVWVYVCALIISTVLIYNTGTWWMVLSDQMNLNFNKNLIYSKKVIYGFVTYGSRLMLMVAVPSPASFLAITL